MKSTNYQEVAGILGGTTGSKLASLSASKPFGGTALVTVAETGEAAVAGEAGKEVKEKVEKKEEKENNYLPEDSSLSSSPRRSRKRNSAVFSSPLAVAR